MTKNREDPERINYFVRDYTLDIDLDLSRTALLVVDLQTTGVTHNSALSTHMQEQGREADVQYRFDRHEQVVIPNVKVLLDYFRSHGLKVVHTVMAANMADYSDAPAIYRPILSAMSAVVGTEHAGFVDEVAPIDGEMIVYKSTLSAFNSSGIDNMLRGADIQYLIVVGISTNMCVESTVRDAADKGYSIILVDDCCGADSDAYHEAGLASMSRLMSRVMRLEEVLHLLDRAREVRKQATRVPEAEIAR